MIMIKITKPTPAETPMITGNETLNALSFLFLTSAVDEVSVVGRIVDLICRGKHQNNVA